MEIAVTAAMDPMSNVVYQDTEQAPTQTDRPAGFQCESALRVAAATLSQATSAEISSTTVVCDVPESGVPAFESLVAEIADKCGLDAEIRQRRGVLSVRFAHPVPVCAPKRRGHGFKSVLARLMAA